MSQWYEANAEMSTIQGTVTCAVMTEMNKADRVLEVACGPGKHSLLLASTFLKVGGVLVSCDYSGAMVKRLRENYETEDTDYRLVPGNKFLFESQTDYTQLTEDGSGLENYCDLDEIVSLQSEGGFRKFVYGCQANNELLPFPDANFGAYIANLSVHLVHNPQNQMAEAFRVLKPGSAACFTIWGAKSESLLFTLIDKALENHMSNAQLKAAQAQPSNFDLYTRDNGVSLKKELESVGFSGIKMWE